MSTVVSFPSQTPNGCRCRVENAYRPRGRTTVGATANIVAQVEVDYYVRMSCRNSSRVFAPGLRMQPSIQLVTVFDEVFETPRMTMHR
jgi:hypothetical protein